MLDTIRDDSGKQWAADQGWHVRARNVSGGFAFWLKPARAKYPASISAYSIADRASLRVTVFDQLGVFLDEWDLDQLFGVYLRNGEWKAGCLKGLLDRALLISESEGKG
jgi:hypothetical protein